MRAWSKWRDGPVNTHRLCRVDAGVLPIADKGVVSKTIDAPYAPGNGGLWRKAKWLNRQEFVVGWTDPEGTRSHLGALLLAYYTGDCWLIYAGRTGTGMPDKVFGDPRRSLAPLSHTQSPLSVLPPRKGGRRSGGSSRSQPERPRSNS
jgi:bifunctional non-homologous end joining protein LigD